VHSSKNNRIITDSIHNDSMGQSKFAKKKKSILKLELILNFNNFNILIFKFYSETS